MKGAMRVGDFCLHFLDRLNLRTDLLGISDDTSVRQSRGFFLLASENGSFVSIEEVILAPV